MDILNIASQWAKDEIFSSKLFIVAGVIFLIISIGFWHLGKTEIARAYVVPFAVCGITMASRLHYYNSFSDNPLSCRQQLP